jgi:hypothetical protein
MTPGVRVCAKCRLRPLPMVAALLLSTFTRFLTVAARAGTEPPCVSMRVDAKASLMIIVDPLASVRGLIVATAL